MMTIPTEYGQMPEVIQRMTLGMTTEREMPASTWLQRDASL
jgi:hypothetical protein